MTNRDDIEVKMQRLVNQLSTFTDKGEVIWTETGDPDAFRAKLKGGMVRIQRSTALNSDGEEVASFFLTLLNGKGQELEDYYPTAATPPERTLIDLWTKARRQARSTVDILDSLLSETNSAKAS